jgi:predicted Ser/Thr protein kinase
LRAEVSAVNQVAPDLATATGAASPLVGSEAETASMPSATACAEDSSTVCNRTEPGPRPDAIGRYRIVGELDSGGQASVYRAMHPNLPLDLAIKIAHKPSPIDKSLMKDDAAILCELAHPNLVHVYDLDVHEDHPFVVMEFVRGRNLQQVADQSLPTPHQAVAWVAAIARALEYVHRRGVVHQDIKPRNIMLDESGRPRLIDFGMARWRHAWSDGQSGPSGGTPAFMAPEQARGEAKRVGAPSDIFALGGVLYFLLTGKTPFGGGTFNEQWRKASQCNFDRLALQDKRVPRRLEQIVFKAMAAQPEDRYASADDLASDLEASLHRPRRLAFQAVALLVAAFAFGIWLLWSRPAREVKPVPASIPGQSLKVDSFEVALHPRIADDPAGLVGVDAFAGRFGQDARVQAQLSMPAYCFLIALNPNGKDQLCYPKAPRIAPFVASTIDYPSDPGKGFGLTDGVGLQAFVLIASTKPLPSYAEWSQAQENLPWRPAETEMVWRYDGRNFEGEKERGDVRPLADLPSPLEATCRALQSRPGVEAIRVLAFPVRPGPAADKP